MTEREQTIATVQRFFDLLQTREIDQWSELWAEDGVQEMPFAPDGFPLVVQGRTALHRHYSALPAAYGRMAFLDRTVYPMEDPTCLAIEYRGEIDVLATGKPYNNRYFGLFRLRDGKIVLFREYFDPTVLTEALGASLGATFNLTREVTLS